MGKGICGVVEDPERRSEERTKKRRYLGDGAFRHCVEGATVRCDNDSELAGSTLDVTFVSYRSVATGLSIVE